MAIDLALSGDALHRARGGDGDLLASQVAGRVIDGIDDLATAIAATSVVARCLVAAPDGLWRLDLLAGDGLAVLLDDDGGDPSTPRSGLASPHLDALVRLVVESAWVPRRPTPIPDPFEVAEPTEVPMSVLDYPGSPLAARLPPSVDPTRLRWWSLQFSSPGLAVADEVTVLDADRGGLFHQVGTRLQPTTCATTWRRILDRLPT